MTFKFCKHASVNIKETLQLHFQNLFQLNMEYVLLGELQVKNAMLYYLTISLVKVNLGT